MDTEHGHSPDEVSARISGPTRRSYLRDTVYGAIDGAVTTFAIVAGVAGAGLSPSIIIALFLCVNTTYRMNYTNKQKYYRQPAI